MRDKIVPIVLGIILTVLADFLTITESPIVRKLFDSLNNLIYDIRLKTYFHEFIGKTPIVIIDIDEKSLQAEGKWPWSRDKITLLANNLKAQGVAVVAFDMIFPDPDKNYAQEIIDSLQPNDPKTIKLLPEIQSLVPNFAYDNFFAKTLSTDDIVLGIFLHNNPDTSNGELPTPLLTVNPTLVKSLVIPEMKKYLTSLPLLQRAAKWGGFTTTIADSDGVLRRSPLLLRYQNGIYPALALAAVRLYLLIDTIHVDIAQIGQAYTVESIHLGDIHIPTDAQGRMLISYRGPIRSFPYYSATDVLHGHIKPGALGGTLAFVGASAFGLGDTHPTPLQSIGFPGVEVHANIAASMLDKKFLYTPSWGKGLEVVLTTLLGIIFSVLFPFISSLSIILSSTLGILLLLIGKPWVLVHYGLILPEVVSILLIIMLVMLNMTYGYLFEHRRRHELKDMFGRYVPATHVEEMLKSGYTFNLEGESKEMSVLFADIRNFTHISESLTASGVKKFLNHLFTPMTKIIFDHHGTIDKYVGDMIMAFWGAPLADTTHAQHALETAMKMLEKVKSLQPEFAQLGIPDVNMGIGLNAGLMNVGDMGSEYRRSYTVLGDEVNLASRLESSTKFYHVNLIVSESIMRYNPLYLFRQLDVVKVKGKQHAIHIYEPLCKISEASDEQKQEIEQYKQAIESYFARQWETAIKQFTTLSTTYPDVYIYQMYLERAHSFMCQPPQEDWDGSYTRTEK